jgi:carbamate kinase
VSAQRPLIVIALGGNALLRRGEPLDAEHQRRNIAVAARAIAALVPEYRLVITHGNGPQVGLLALQSEAVPGSAPFPLDVLGAESEGMIGYLIEQALGDHLDPSSIATLLTQTVVDPDDPAFSAPTKPIGPTYTQAAAQQLATERGWTVAADGGYFRRVVASPEPLEIVELHTIKILLAAGVIVICGGGGGIPVITAGAGHSGVEAVIDKDLSTSLLARRLGADMLVMVTDVEVVEANWGTPAAYPIHAAHPQELRELAFATGSMAPKVEAACRFTEATGAVAAIGSLNHIGELVHGRTGTLISATAAARLPA